MLCVRTYYVRCRQWVTAVITVITKIHYIGGCFDYIGLYSSILVRVNVVQL